MPIRAALVLGLAALLSACGDAPERPTALPSGGASAFELVRAPTRVKHDVPLDEVRLGIQDRPPRDAIPALRAPQLVRVFAAAHMRDDDRVLVFVEGEDARAYPVFLLDGHELVNDVVGGRPVLVTWCPLCGSGAVFARRVEGLVRTFGVSGYLWRSDVLMYDRESETFWSQIGARAVVGPLSGARLTALPAYVTSWSDFRTRHPEGRVLLTGGREGGDPAHYRVDRYADYRNSPDLMSGLAFADDRLARKEEVLGVVVEGRAHAWSLEYVRAAGRQASASVGAEFKDLEETVGATPVRLRYWPAADRVEVLDGGGRGLLVALRCYWFAWALFHPDTGLTGGIPPR